MQTLLIPTLIVLIPLIILYTILFFHKEKEISSFEKMIFGFFFFFLGIVCSFYAVAFSVEAIVASGVKCATGAGVFLPFGVLVNTFGIFYLLSAHKIKKQ